MRISGDFSLGANYSKGSNVGTLEFSGNLNYRKVKTNTSISWDTNNTYQADSLKNSTKSNRANSFDEPLLRG